MSKTKTIFICQSCGVQSPKWLGKCPSCGEWNTFVEEVVQKENTHGGKAGGKGYIPKVQPTLLSSIREESLIRFSSGDPEFDRVLGGGIVPGSLVLIGGDPGIGKSTLLLQIALKLTKQKILYVTGEESASQIRMRALRLSAIHDHCFILPETNTEEIIGSIEQLMPDLVIIDSIQTLSSPYLDAAPGSVSQIRQCASELMKISKESNIPVCMIGHINKEGSLAGPKVLEHMVDTVLQFEGDRHHIYRILRSIKNRFGSTSEIGIYEMHGDGLTIVSNPSEILVTQRDENVSGIAIGATIEGIRPLLIEVQALVGTAAFGTPQRSTTGFDFKRMNMLIAVLEKRAGFRLGVQDVFLNITGGIRVEDPALDLSVCMAIISSYREIPIAHDTCFAAEIGLSGELRTVNRVDNRISEAEKQGFKKIVVSKYNSNIKKKSTTIEIIPFRRIDEVVSFAMGK